MAQKPAPVGTTSAAQVLEQPKLRVVDAAMILLALFSVTIVFVDIFARRWLYDFGIFQAVIIVDLVITLIFAADFVLENRKKSPVRWLKDSWFDLLGLVPMIAFVYMQARITGVPFDAAFSGETRLLGGAAAGGSLIRLLRLVRIVRIVQAFSRFLRATNMTFGETVTKRVFDKYRRIIVAELTTPIMVAGITVTQELVIRMKFLESVGHAIDEQRPQIHEAVIEAMKANRVPDQIITQPIVDRITVQVETAVVDNIVATLTGPEINALTQKMIVDVMENFKQQLQSPEGKALLKQMGTAPPKQKDLPGSKVAADTKAFDGPSSL